MSWFAQVATTLIAIVGALLLGAGLAVALYALVREARRNVVFLDPIDVPRSLDARGYSAGVIAERILYALSVMRHRAHEALRDRVREATVVDLHAGGRSSLQRVARGLYRLLGKSEVHVGGEITREAGGYELTLRRRERTSAAIVGVHRGPDIGSLLSLGAEDLLRMLDPWVLAQHHFAQESREPASEFPRTMAALEYMLKYCAAAERPFALNMQGLCLMQQKRLDEAIDCFARGAAARPELAFLHQNWANALDLMGHYDEARARRSSALAIPGRDAAAIAGNAVHASLLHRHDQALALARRALAADPRNPSAWSAWSHVLFGRHRLEQAASACERASMLGARDSGGSSASAMVYAALAQPEKALPAAFEAIDKSGENDQTLKGMGFARLSAGDARGAVKDFETALSLAPGAGDAAYGRGDAMLALREPEIALALYEQAVAIDPFYPQAHTGWARSLRALGRIDEAPARFAVAVRVDPAYAPAYRGWAESLNALGRGEEARSLLAKAASVERRNRSPLPMRQIAAHASRVR